MIPSERVITLELNVALARALQIPLKLTLGELPHGWRLKAPLPPSLLTQGKRTSFSFDLIVDGRADEETQNDTEQLKLTLTYLSEVSGLSHTLTLCSAELYGESTCDQARSRRDDLGRTSRPAPLRVPLPRLFKSR